MSQTKFATTPSLLSTLTNTVDLIGKAVLSRKSEATSKDTIPDANEVKKDNRYKKHLKVKSIKRCLIASVPVAGNGAVLIYDLSKGASKFVSFCIKQYKQNLASKIDNATVHSNDNSNEEASGSSESSTTSSKHSNTSSKSSSEDSLEISKKEESATSTDRDSSNHKLKTGEKSFKAAESETTKTPESSSSSWAGTAETSETSLEDPEASEISESYNTEEEPIEEQKPVPSAEAVHDFIVKELKHRNTKSTPAETFEDKGYGMCNMVTTQTFISGVLTLTSKHYSSVEGKPVLALCIKITAPRDCVIAENITLLTQFLAKEKLLEFNQGDGPPPGDVEIICRSEEAMELGVELISTLTQEFLDAKLSLGWSLSLVLDATQLQRVVLKNLCNDDHQILSSIFEALPHTFRRCELLTTKSNPFFMEFIKRFSDRNSSIDSLKLIQDWLMSSLPIDLGAKKQICLAAVDSLVKLIQEEEFSWSGDRALELVNIIRLTGVKFGATQQKNPLLASTINSFRLLSKEKASSLLNRLLTLAEWDYESEMNLNFWLNLASPLIKLVNKGVNIDSERYHPPKISLVKNGSPQARKFLFDGWLVDQPDSSKEDSSTA